MNLLDLQQFVVQSDVQAQINAEIGAAEINRQMLTLYLENLDSESCDFEKFRNLTRLAIGIPYQDKFKILENVNISSEKINHVKKTIENFELNLKAPNYQNCSSMISHNALLAININQVQIKNNPQFFDFFEKFINFIKRLTIDQSLEKNVARNLYISTFSDIGFPRHFNAKTLCAILYSIRPDAFPLINDYVLGQIKNFVNKLDPKSPKDYIDAAIVLDKLLDDISQQSHFGIIDRIMAIMSQTSDTIDFPMSDSNTEVSYITTSSGNKMCNKNQILYGAAGTGKTYHTINEALKIIDPAFLDTAPNRTQIKARFDELAKQRRIQFVTFHQSFSYEDFVEGIGVTIHSSDRDDEAENGLGYEVKSGIFKQICQDALRQPIVEKELGIRPDATVWKISMSDENIKHYCFEHNEARVGWSDIGDLSNPQTRNQDEFKNLGSNDKHTLNNFENNIQIGDVLICLKTTSEISAVGVVTSNYIYESNHTGSTSHHRHVRKVDWIYKNINFNILNLNQQKYLTLKTVYELYRMTWPMLSAALVEQGFKLKINITQDKVSDPYVLIIDEINRGNISRIFGELITLLEDSKRAGEDESLSIILPYSKEKFSVPNNVYIIGTMNNSDRSLTGLDIALRRRFSFVEMQPNPILLKGIVVDGLQIDQLLDTMNERIEVLLDRDHCIGHAYFMPLNQDQSIEKLKEIFEQKILPLLQEYFYDDWQRIDWVLNCNGMLKRKHDDAALKKLFPKVEQSNLQNHSWTIQTDQLSQIEAYQNILGHAQ